MRNAPEWFEKKLEVFDRNLRVRWSNERGKWAIEEKRPREFLFKPVKMRVGVFGKIEEHILPEDSDRFICYRDGYSIVFYANNLTENIFTELRNMFIGNLEAYGNSLEEKLKQDYKEEEERKQAAENLLIKDISEGIYSKYKFEANRI